MSAYEDNVFINCPFDKAYEPLLHILLFTIQCCNFLPRTAKEINDSAQNRIDKIYGLVEQCRYGIHDISRTELDDLNQLPRFNMPFELGVFLGAARFGNEQQKRKRVLVLDRERYRFQRFLSDLAGIDPHVHGGDPDKLVREVRRWLADVSRRSLPGARTILRRYEKFQVRLPELTAQVDLEVDELSYGERLDFTAAFLAELGHEAKTLPRD